jgi:hypothetical protein
MTGSFCENTEVCSGGSAGSPQKCDKLLYGETGLPYESPQGALRKFAMFGNSESAIGRRNVPEDDVTACLVIRFVADTDKGAHGI